MGTVAAKAAAGLQGKAVVIILEGMGPVGWLLLGGVIGVAAGATAVIAISRTIR